MAGSRTPKHLGETPTRGQRAADRMASIIGSWPFLLSQTGLLVVWFSFNGYVAIRYLHGWAFDPAPFFIANLLMSAQASITGPALLISNNRQAQIDRQHAEASYEHTDQILSLQLDQMNRLEQLAREKE